MNSTRWQLAFGVFVVASAILIPLYMAVPNRAPVFDDPRAHLPERLPATDHSALMTGMYFDGPSVTRRCLECHEEAAGEIMATTHWTWESHEAQVAGHDGVHKLGKKNVINNFCIGVQSNWTGCTSCHAGYGWSDDNFDFSAQDAVDCLVCHDQSGLYRKSLSGLPAEGVDLTAAAQSVGGPTRNNCGGCHFRGGGGDAVKHGDLDGSLLNPPARIDVHMGEHDMICTDCHSTQSHYIAGRSITAGADHPNAVQCTDCHSRKPHGEERIDLHVTAVACQTCHIPQVALREATKTHWDWSTAGQDRDEDPHVYLKKKGSFEYERSLTPEYLWFDGTAGRYLLGDSVAGDGPTAMNPPQGSIDDTRALIWPFKIHRARQPYDTELGHLLVPKTVGEDGFWKTFDWNSALSRGAEATGISYSGRFDFAETEMHWPLTHMVAPAQEALDCRACHAPEGLLDWRALGYPGDPMEWGSRSLTASEEARR